MSAAVQCDAFAEPRIRVRPAILIVEDEPILAKDLQCTLIDLGYDAYAIASSVSTAIRRAGERPPDLVLMDVLIKGPVDGIEAASILRKQFSSALIFLSADGDPAMIERAKQIDPHGYLLKPVGVGQLRAAVEIALYKHQLERARVQYEESLRLATRKAEVANSAKSLFLANMSHEIRTPVNAVIGLAYLLERTALSSEQAGFVTQINLASQSLLSVTTDVLDISKIEAGELSISRGVFDVRRLLNGLRAIMSVHADAKGITLQFNVADDVPAAFEGDSARLNQILTNLLSNAIKFTECGGVTLNVRLLESTAAGSTVSFAVRDTGIGIDPAAQARLFTPFIQGDESITRRYGGTGLGLSIVNSLVKMMGGSVDLTSKAGVGSEFRVVLGFEFATVESLATKQPALCLGERPLAGVRVLVVDDYELNRVVTTGMLEQAGALACVASNGKEAFDQLLLQANSFDVILMDVQMPIMDGCMATRLIRSKLGLLDLPIIALTAGVLSSDRQRATTAGMNDFIVKPFDAAALISCVSHHSAIGRVPSQRSAPALEPAKAALAWPEIEGIDTRIARNRWCDDLPLFRSMLESCLDEFADIAVPSSQAEPLGCQAALLHKLRGGACMLGAKAIGDLAAEAQAACWAGNAVRAGECSILLARHLNALRLSTKLAFERTQPGEVPPAAPGDIRLEPRVLAQHERINALSAHPSQLDSDGRCCVLVVDDDDIVRAHVADLLERSGYRVGQVASGAEALRAVHNGDYRILITDWKIAGKGGREFCHGLRESIENRNLYVIIVSASDRPEDVDLAQAAGADAYVLRGASDEELLWSTAAAQQITQLRFSEREIERVFPIGKGKYSGMDRRPVPIEDGPGISLKRSS